MALPHHHDADPSSLKAVAEPSTQDVNPGLAIVGQVAGGLLHDFNNILTVITGTIDILAEAVEDRPELAAVARLIDEAATRGARLTSQLLSFARGRPPRPCAVGLAELLTDVGRLLRPTLGTDVEITTTVDSNVPAVFVDPGQLMAALLCLGIAARNGMKSGGRIDIAAMRQGSPAEDVSDRDVMIVLRASAHDEEVLRTGSVFQDIRMVEDFVRRSNGRLALPESRDQAATVEIVLPCAAHDPA
uniref:histidine kinase dimerization/phospho-acceptor domain-containing protein n=1 Tax=Bradyrhizobium sp. (strain ORS 278) TaxID=114615 RepID=UPI0005A0959C|nr:histidine kinase dimerization/phospho-acceptor domain-containing protein [Bradyrhizobium sp. ORS 278]